MIIFYLLSLVTVGFVLYHSRDKLGLRVRRLVDKTKETATNQIGNITDDYTQKINETKKENQELEKQLVRLKQEMLTLERRCNKALDNAQTYAEQAEYAISIENEAAAREALILKQTAEKEVQTYNIALKNSEDTFNKLLGQLQQRENKVKEAESNRVVFEATYKSMELTKRMKESEKLFGGSGRLDFTSSVEELAQMQDELKAIDYVQGSSELDKISYQVSQDSIEKELIKLKTTVQSKLIG